MRDMSHTAARCCGPAKWLLTLVACLPGCIEDLPIDVPLIDVGYTYECTVTIECDGEAFDERSTSCDDPGRLEDITLELHERCLRDLGPELGCSSWSCSEVCSSVSYCTL